MIHADNKCLYPDKFCCYLAELNELNELNIEPCLN